MADDELSVKQGESNEFAMQQQVVAIEFVAQSFVAATFSAAMHRLFESGHADARLETIYCMYAGVAEPIYGLP